MGGVGGGGVTKKERTVGIKPMAGFCCDVLWCGVLVCEFIQTHINMEAVYDRWYGTSNARTRVMTRRKQLHVQYGS